MKTPLAFYAIALFTLGFVLLNGHHNLLSVLFVGLLLTLFIGIPLFIRIKYLIRDMPRYSFIRGKQWA